ncbi:MAG: hypothetical protein JWS11_166 [Cypionkella sp.]|nr:hypothetical protein [Cypionkella sp.]
MTFTEFLTSRKVSHDAKGDFVRLALSDPHLPHFENWSETRAYIVQRHDNEAIADAGEDVWKEYQSAQRRALRASRAKSNEA